MAVGLAKPPTLIEKYFGADAPMAQAVCMAESGCVSKISPVNWDGSYDYGIFQINSVHRNLVGDLNQLLDPETNVRVAAQIFHQQGWSPWSTFKNGKYKEFLK